MYSGYGYSDPSRILGGATAVFIVIAVVALFLIGCVKVVPQAKEYVIERLGKYGYKGYFGIEYGAPEDASPLISEALSLIDSYL